MKLVKYPVQEEKWTTGDGWHYFGSLLKSSSMSGCSLVLCKDSIFISFNIGSSYVACKSGENVWFCLSW